ncbi:MAG: AsnC family transcriptional regulator [Bacillota bacterium]
MNLDNFDRKLLNLIQTSFPITPEPYRELAETLGTTEEEIIRRLEKMRDTGIIRRLGGIFDSRKLGYRGTLCALKVPPGRISEVAEIINEYPGVTHNYIRDHDYNMWFTLLAENQAKIDGILAEIRAAAGIDQLLNLPARGIYKIKVQFDLSEVEHVK